MLCVDMRYAALAAALALASSGCVTARYQYVAPIHFAPAAPAGALMPALVQQATALGYVLDSLDPMRGVFAVHSRMLGRPPRRRGRPVNPSRTDLFVVQVRDGDVTVRAFGRHVDANGFMHPTLAQELEIFGDSMRRAADVVVGAMPAGGTMPPPPPAYGGATPSYGAPAGYGQPAPPPAYGAQPPSVWGATAPPPATGAPPQQAAPQQAAPQQAAPQQAAPQQAGPDPAPSDSAASRLGSPH